MSVEGPIDLVQQVRAHLEALQAAGVLLVPRGGPLAIPQLRLVPAPTDHAPARLGAVTEPEPAADPLDSRRRELETLRAEVPACDKCSELFSTRTPPDNPNVTAFAFFLTPTFGNPWSG